MALVDVFEPAMRTSKMSTKESGSEDIRDGDKRGRTVSRGALSNKEESKESSGKLHDERTDMKQQTKGNWTEERNEGKPCGREGMGRVVTIVLRRARFLCKVKLFMVNPVMFFTPFVS